MLLSQRPELAVDSGKVIVYLEHVVQYVEVYQA